jgi:hypothetical protein
MRTWSLVVLTVACLGWFVICDSGREEPCALAADDRDQWHTSGFDDGWTRVAAGRCPRLPVRGWFVVGGLAKLSVIAMMWRCGTTPMDAGAISVGTGTTGDSWLHRWVWTPRTEFRWCGRR